MWHDPIVDEIDHARRVLLEECGGNLTTLMDRMALDRVDQDGRWLVTVDRNIHQGVRARLAVELLEVVGVNGDGL